MKALDTNVVVRLLINDDRKQAQKAKRLLQRAERDGEAFLLTEPVVLELIWVLTASYGFTRAETLEALGLLAELPVLQFESYDSTIELIRLGTSTRADLPDLLIGLSAKARGCDSTLTFDQGLSSTRLFEEL